MEINFYLCSSPRHLYLAMGLAQSLPNARHYLLVINQPSINPFVAALLEDPAPFEAAEVFEAGKGFREKIGNKRRCLSRLAELVAELRPSRVFGGNDRRVEFQYAMFRARGENPTAVGAYLDDGTGSYINGVYLRRWRTVVDLTADRLLKRLFYGRWYDKQRLLGGTRWVQECHLSFPELAPDGLRARKQVTQLDNALFRTPAFKQRLATIVEAYGFSEGGGAAFPRPDAFVVLPHSRLVERYFGGFERYNAILLEYLRQFSSIAVKYHPRETNFYLQSSADLVVFPASIPAEVVFSLIEPGCVVGDVSSALLSAAWLIPESRAICLCPEGLTGHTVLSLVERVPVEIVYC